MSFGKYAILDNARYVFKNDESMWWEFSPITAGDELKLSRFFQDGRVVIEDGARKAVPVTTPDVAIMELTLSFGGASMTKLTAESPLAEKKAFIQSMPAAMMVEVWEAMGVCLPLWGPAKPGDPAENPAE